MNFKKTIIFNPLQIRAKKIRQSSPDSPSKGSFNRSATTLAISGHRKKVPGSKDDQGEVALHTSPLRQARPSPISLSSLSHPSRNKQTSNSGNGSSSGGGGVTGGIQALISKLRGANMEEPLGPDEQWIRYYVGPKRIINTIFFIYLWQISYE